MVYRYWKEGLPGITPPIARSIVLLAGHLVVVFKYLAGLGVRGLRYVHPIHISKFIHHRRTIDHVKGTLVRDLLGIELLYRFRSEEMILELPSPARIVGWRLGWPHRPGAFNGWYCVDPAGGAPATVRHCRGVAGEALLARRTPCSTSGTWACALAGHAKVVSLVPRF